MKGMCGCVTAALAAVTLIAGTAAGSAPSRPLGGVLYDQYSFFGANSYASNEFEPTFNQNDTEIADDFSVPGGPGWNVTGIDARGVYFNGPGPAQSFNVRFYTNAAGDLPGLPACERLHLPYTVGSGGRVMVDLAKSCRLSGGATYWLSVQAQMNFHVAGAWGWADRQVRSNSDSAFRYPNDPSAGLRNNWSRANIENDQVFLIRGA